MRGGIVRIGCPLSLCMSRDYTDSAPIPTKSAAMYDIKWIREHPDDLRPRPETARAGAAVGQAACARRRAPRGDHQASSRRRRGATRRRRKSARPRRRRTKQRAQKLMAEVAEAEDVDPGAGSRAEEARVTSSTKSWRKFPTCRPTTCRTARTSTAMSSITSGGKKRDYAFKPKQHFELGEALGMMDFELAAKLSGARFVVLQKGLARMERALGQFFLDVHTSEKHGYTEVNPPLLVRDRSDVWHGAIAEIRGRPISGDPRNYLQRVCRSLAMKKYATSIVHRSVEMSRRSATSIIRRNLDSASKPRSCVKRRIAFGSSPPPKCR